MKKTATKFYLCILTLFIVAGIGYLSLSYFGWDDGKKLSTVQRAIGKREEAESEGKNEIEERERLIEGREEYFFRLQRNPKTNAIPKNIRAKELNHARKIPTRNNLRLQKPSSPTQTASTSTGFDWSLAGPSNVGGRTRTLGIDRRNQNIIIAGGVSGGIWKSTDGGSHWNLRTPNFENLSVTTLAQDHTNPDTWYYAAGEYIGNSASSRSASGFNIAPYYGTGIFKSTNNGDSWQRISGTRDVNAVFDSQFDFVSRLVVSPVTGTVFIASNASGIYRAPNGKNFNNLALGGPNLHTFYDVAAASDGTIAAILSTDNFANNGNPNPGIFISNDDGLNWTEITPASFPAKYARSVIAFAPSDPNILYVFTDKLSSSTNQGVSFYKLDLSSKPSSAEDRGGNLPDFGGSVGGIDLQNDYNMTLTVKPDDPNFVTVGATNLFRSRDGFATAPSGDSQSQKDEFWIGGYAKANDISSYPNQHPDQHAQVYDPSDANRLWTGSDGGVSVTNDVSANAVQWVDKNKGYIVTQFYDASIAADSNDTRVLGGTQDNGSPFFAFDANGNNRQTLQSDISSGDGGYSFLTKNYIFVSNAKNGDGEHRIIRYSISQSGNIGDSFAYVQPASDSGPAFINPYELDPNDENVMYFPSGNRLMRNTKIGEITNQNSSGTSRGWSNLGAASLPAGYNITAIKVSTIPENILYYAGSSYSANNQRVPIIKRLDKAKNSNETPIDISIPGAEKGAYVNDIAINPADGNELIAVMSNYDIVGLFHSSDGGESWQAVEGNLMGDNNEQSSNQGPSLRTAAIIPAKSSPIYVVGTSTGLYSTQSLDDKNTQWTREASNTIGFSVIENINARFSNGDIAAGSHGRGMFFGQFQGQVTSANVPRISIKPAEARADEQVTITASNFLFDPKAANNKVTFGNIKAMVKEASPTQLTVVVPRNTLAPDAKNEIVSVSVKNENGANPGSYNFKILPPIINELKQNFPNPFTSEDQMVIPITLQQSSIVTIQIYSTTGRRVNQTIKNKVYKAGTYNVPIDFSGKASGVYIYRIIAKSTDSDDEFVDSKKFTYIK